jgi:hypothetical protein
LGGRHTRFGRSGSARLKAIEAFYACRPGIVLQQGDPIEIVFRVENENSRYVVIDASVAGVWIGLE